MANLKIFPPIGAARIGNSNEFYVGPELPGVPSNWDFKNKQHFPFKDKDGKILRQAARFHIFDFDTDGNPTREISSDAGFKIEWRVNVANRKASFFSFNGQSGARSSTAAPYVDRDLPNRTPDSVEKEFFGRGEPEIKNRRNAGVADRRSLEIIPGEVAISELGIKQLIDANSKNPINLLGEIRMEQSGSLLFLSAFGRTEKLPGAAPLEEYANNDGWFDDMGDGSISATVTFPDGHTEKAESAWVIVGPPDFAPGIGNVVSLYDTIWDISVRTPLACQAGNDLDLKDLLAQQAAWQNSTNDFAATYKPSFKKHIYPILARALAAFDVHEDPERPSYHGTLFDWERLNSPAENKIRLGVFSRMRDPNSTTVDRLNMPRGLGDDYTTLDDSESDETVFPSSSAFLSVTRVQYALLKAWANNNFESDWDLGGDLKYIPTPDSSPITPQGLTTAALENCVGGPFFPGIEVSWLIRETELYASAFRFKESGVTLGPLTLGPGFFSQQMALPWQADFYDCHKEEHTPKGSDTLVYMWWTAQRPDDIRPDAISPKRRWVLSFDENHDPNITDPDAIENLSRFEQMRTRWSELSFVVLVGDEYVEQK
jgi:hypothetical protein